MRGWCWKTCEVIVRGWFRWVIFLSFLLEWIVGCNFVRGRNLTKCLSPKMFVGWPSRMTHLLDRQQVVSRLVPFLHISGSPSPFFSTQFQLCCHTSSLRFVGRESKHDRSHAPKQSTRWCWAIARGVPKIESKRINIGWVLTCPNIQQSPHFWMFTRDVDGWYSLMARCMVEPKMERCLIFFAAKPWVGQLHGR